MLESVNVSAIQEETFSWFALRVWNVETLVQCTIVCMAFAIGYILHRRSETKIINAINKLEATTRIKQILHSFRKMVFPASVLILLFISQLGKTLEFFESNFGLVDAVTSLITAWVIIRMLVQFIKNHIVRNLAALSIWIIAALSILGVLGETAATLDSVGFDMGQLRVSALTLTKGLLALSFLLYAANLASSLIEQKIRRVSGMTMSSRVLISKVIRFTLITFALLIGITSAGIDLSLLAVFSGALGLGVGFGLQKGISNLFSGLLLLMDKSIKPGDVIELPNGAFGWVAHMGGRYTEIVTRDNKSFLIPNEDFITHQVVNWSHGSTLIRLEVTFGVHYDSDPHVVKKLAQEAAKLPERVVAEPAPICHLVEFGDSSLNFALRFWIKDAEKGVTNMRGDVMLAIWDTFKENNIAIPYPHREVYIHDANTGNTVKKKAVAS